MQDRGFQKLDSVSFDRWIAVQDPFHNPTDTLDMNGVRLVTPAALVQLAALCHALVQTGRRPTLLVDDFRVRGYLIRAGFVETLDPIAAFDPPFLGLASAVRGPRGISSPLLIEVTKIESEVVLPELLDTIVAVLRARLQYEKQDAFNVAIAVSEVCQNTFDHNPAACGFLAMQVYEAQDGKFLEIGVADYGDGLLATLLRNPKHAAMASDLDAIQEATQQGISEYEDRTRGTGLYHLLEIAYAHHGTVQIRSGAAKARYRMDQRKGWGFPVLPVPGVHITLILPWKYRQWRAMTALAS